MTIDMAVLREMLMQAALSRNAEIHGVSLPKEVVETIVVALSPATVPAETGIGAWIIWFEDADVKPEIFFGFGAEQAAKRAFKERSIDWNCHLFQRVEAATLVGQKKVSRE